MSLPPIEVIIGNDVHAPRIWEEYRKKNWAPLVRYWFAHQHKPAMRAAIYILHDLRASHDAAPQISFTILALKLNTFLINPSAQHHLAMGMQDMTGEWNEEEKLTLAFLRLLPRLSLCEEALLMPLNKQASLISDGLRAAEEACGIAQTLQDLPMYAMLRSIIASTFTQLSQYEAAKQNFDEALTARRSLAQSNRPVYCFDLALSLMNYANLQERFAKPDSARSAFQESVTLYREAAPQNPNDFLPDLARCLSNFGGFLCSQGESTLARVHLEEGAQILRPAAAKHPAYKRDLAQCLNNLGNVLDELGDPTRAEEVLTEAVSILQPLAEQDTSGTLEHLLVMVQSNLARVGQHTGQGGSFRAIVETHRRLAKIHPYMYRSALAVALANLGVDRLNHEDFVAANEALLEAATLFAAEAAQRPDAALDHRILCLRSLGNMLLGNHPEIGSPNLAAARDTLRQARMCVEQFRAAQHSLAHRERIQNESVDVYALSFKANIDAWKQFNDPTALREAIEIAEASRARNLNELLSDTLFTPANAPREIVDQFIWLRSQLNLAIRDLHAAANPDDLIAKGPAAGVGLQEQLTSLQEKVDRFRIKYENTLARIRGAYDAEFDPDRALATIDLDTAQHLLSLDVPTVLIQFTLTLDDAYAVVISSTTAEALPLPDINEKKAMMLALEWLQAYARRRSHHAEHLRQIKRERGKSLNPQRLRMLANFQHLVESGVLDKYSGGSGRQQPHKSYADPEEWYIDYLENSLLTSPDADVIAPEWSTILPHMLQPVAEAVIHPIIDKLRATGAKRIIISAKGALHVFPLHACRLDKAPYYPKAGTDYLGRKVFEAMVGEKEFIDDGPRLIDEFEVLYAPSISALYQCASRPRADEGAIVMVENPTHDLPFAEVECDLIDSHYSHSRRLSGISATKATLQQHAAESGIFTIAAHSYFDPYDPLGSAVILSDKSDKSTWLTIRDIFSSIRLGNNILTVLSGCESGMLLPDRIDEYVSLSSAFLFAGAQAVVSSLWETDDFPTALLMDRLHLELRRGQHVAAALREAQRWLRCDIKSGTALVGEVLPGLLVRIKDDDLKVFCTSKAEFYQERFPNDPPFAAAAHWAAFTVSGWGLPRDPFLLTAREKAFPASARNSQTLEPLAESSSASIKADFKVPEKWRTLTTQKRDLSSDLLELGRPATESYAHDIVAELRHHERRRKFGQVRRLLQNLSISKSFAQFLEDETSRHKASDLQLFIEALKLLETGSREVGIHKLEECVRAAREANDSGLTCAALIALGHAYLVEGHSKASLEYYYEALPGTPSSLRRMLDEGLAEAAETLSQDGLETLSELLEGDAARDRVTSLNRRVAQCSGLPLPEMLEALMQILAEVRGSSSMTEEAFVQVARFQALLLHQDETAKNVRQEIVELLGRAANREREAFEGLMRSAEVSVAAARASLDSASGSSFQQGIRQYRAGLLSEALASFDAGVESGQSEGRDQNTVHNLIAAARTLISIGQPNEAEKRLSAAKEIATTINDHNAGKAIDKVKSEIEQSRSGRALARLRDNAFSELRAGRLFDAVRSFEAALESAQAAENQEEINIIMFGLANALVGALQPMRAAEIMGRLRSALGQESDVTELVLPRIQQLESEISATVERIRSAERSIMEQMQRAETDDARGIVCMAMASAMASDDPIGALHFAQMACQFLEVGKLNSELAEAYAIRATVLAAFRFFDEAENLARKAISIGAEATDRDQRSLMPRLLDYIAAERPKTTTETESETPSD